jgi:hypothetical protein
MMFIKNDHTGNDKGPSQKPPNRNEDQASRRKRHAGGETRTVKPSEIAVFGEQNCGYP